ncbi:helix-turn-helix transcriptional regulator [Solicola gregarius]|uniref:YafY family transcriptional regulator n=1 Tax=Solicola gregarius TaxID=2908642 RepID=A0AA46TEW9_9ACTN|nr:YafY family protein [Solicola gregarius]UYM04089.1 YafY family transcriptional regulator [Solicola gregarius]
MKADRLLSIMLLLRGRASMSARELADHLEVSARTVMRDIEALSAAGVPVYAERGRNGGFSLLEGFRADVSALTDDEAQVLFAYTGLDTLSDLGLGSQVRQTLDKLASTAPDRTLERARDLRDVVHVDRRRWFVDPDDSRHLPTLRMAAVRNQRVRMSYRGASDARAKQRTVDPYGLIENGGRWYLLAHHRGSTKTYRVGRVTSLSVLDATFERPAGFDLDAEWERMRERFERPGEDNITLEFRCSRAEERQVRRACQPMLVSGTTIDTDESGPDSVLMRCTFRIRRAAIGTLLAFAGDVEVLAPSDLRTEMREVARAAAATYEA